MSERLIVALDTADRRQATAWVEALLPEVCLFKIGLELFLAHGAAVVKDVADAGGRIFLDLKFHDIPNTVAGAISSVCAQPGVAMVTLHAAGGRAMLGAAVAAVRGVEQPGFLPLIPGTRRPGLIGITVLTSLDDQDLRETGVPSVTAEQVQRLGRLARQSGLDGLVCSPREVSALRQELGPDFVLITPGIRPSGSGHGDQKRTAAPAQAVNDGATYLVVGRPITAAASPADAARAILDTLP